MLTNKQRKDILKLIKRYSFFQMYLKKHYNLNASHYAGILADCAKNYLRTMEAGADKIAKQDIKYYVLLASKFGGMRRDFLLDELQKYADFDVRYFLEQNNRSLLKRALCPAKKFRKEILETQAEIICDKYRDLCNTAAAGKGSYSNNKKIKNIREMVYGYAGAIVNHTVTVHAENLESTYRLLGTVCYPYCEGDVADKAKKMLKSEMSKNKENQDDKHTEYELPLDIEKKFIKKHYVKKSHHKSVQNTKKKVNIDKSVFVRDTAIVVVSLAIACAVAVGVVHAVNKKSDVKPAKQEVKQPIKKSDTVIEKNVSKSRSLDTVYTPLMMARDQKGMIL